MLAGGLGTRLGKATAETPKPLLECGGKPFLEYLLWNLARHGIREIILSTGYLAGRIEAHFGSTGPLGVSLRYSVEEEPLGTGGAVGLARTMLADEFLVINGDTLNELNYLDLTLSLQDSALIGAMALRRVEDVSQYGQVELRDGRVVSFAEKSGIGPGLINGGIYALRNEVLDKIPEGGSSLERDIFPGLAREGRLAGKPYDGFFLDIGLPETLARAQTALPDWQRKPAVFFDRDGTLNLDHGYVHTKDKFQWLEGAREAVKLANDRGYLVLVITNQSGIGRGYYDEDHFADFSAWINSELRKSGAHLDATYRCPHHPTEARGEYLKACGCRKPEPGMILQATEEWDIDPAGSVLFGDKESDIEAARRAGIRGVLYEGGSLLDLVREKLR